MKKSNILKLLAFLVILALALSPLQLFADPNLYRLCSYKLAGSAGLANRTYYIEKTARDAGYETAIVNACNDWVNATNSNPSKSKVGLTRVSSASAATIIFSAQAEANFPPAVRSARGYVLYYDGSSSISQPGGMPSRNWTKVYVNLKTDLKSNARRTACHEIGHAFGLGHPMTSDYSTIASVMRPHDDPVKDKSLIRSTPTSSDVSNLRNIYY